MEAKSWEAENRDQNKSAGSKRSELCHRRFFRFVVGQCGLSPADANRFQSVIFSTSGEGINIASLPKGSCIRPMLHDCSIFAVERCSSARLGANRTRPQFIPTNNQQSLLTVCPWSFLFSLFFICSIRPADSTKRHCTESSFLKNKQIQSSIKYT